jgi:dipeptidyl aminopeptidase/acylaminoacyl peptidase
MEHPDEVYAISGGQERILTNTNPQSKTWKLGTAEERSWKSSKDGKTIHGVLLLPAGYEKGKRYKTIVHIHGGPEEAWSAGFHGSWYDWGSILASHGYAVLLPNPRGSDGAGTAFSEANYRDWGIGDFQDIMDGIDMLVSQGIADEGHLGVGGWSFGGFMTSWTVTHTDRFKAAIVGAAVTDLFTMATTSDIDPSYLDGYYGDLASNRKLYDEHSPVRFLEHCHTPTLVIHGEADVRVPVSQGQEFYYGLRFLGRETQMVRYPREPHIFREMEHQRDSLERMLRWYDAHI